jgi:hypothetical protein
MEQLIREKCFSKIKRRIKMSNRLLRNESTPEAREIWRAVENAAAKAPDWVKERIEKSVIVEDENAK